MKIYIVEDNALKASKLIAFLATEFPMLGNPEVFCSYQSGLRAIESVPPSLILMDMTLPTFDRKPNSREGRARPLGGYEIMRKMALKSIASSVIVVTQLESFGEGDEEVGFTDLTERCGREFPGVFAGGVYFDQGDASWRNDLLALLKKWIEK